MSLEYNSLMTSFVLKSLINSPTRVTPKSQSSIDHISFRIRDDLSMLGGKLDMGITDHSEIFCVIGSFVKILKVTKILNPSSEK